jgi:hypothetical protein
MADIQGVDAFIDHQIHNLQYFPHQQDKSQDKEDHDKRESNFPKYIAVNNFIHIAIKKFLKKLACIDDFAQAKAGHSVAFSSPFHHCCSKQYLAGNLLLQEP